MAGNNPLNNGPLAPGEHQQEEQQQQPDYSTWSNTSLIERITELERQLHSRTAEFTFPPAPSKAKTHTQAQALVLEKAAQHATKQQKQGFRKMDTANYNYRHIALKFAYLGQRYNGLEHANGNITPLPTIEEEMWKALRKTRLISPTDMEEEPFDMRGRRKSTEPFTLSWEGCDYSKAGRTDRGVSAFGQVIGIKVRSARPKRKAPEPVQGEEETDSAAKSDAMAVDDNWDDIANELPYIGLLNKALPEDIRVLAWCPHLPEDFNARFSCRGRHYKYFFTQPAFSPTPGPLGFLPLEGNEKPKVREGWLDIDAMREAAKYFEGVNDFRNFCKVDTSKQIENFQRIIYKADIELLDPKSNPIGYVNRPDFQAQEHPVAEGPNEPQTSAPPGSQVYVFDLQGSAFLWHQVRHMVGILFLVGQGLEPPTVVRDLLDVSKNPRKPMYEMASDAPLVLWDCFFPEQNTDPRDDALEWVYAGDARQTKSAFLKGGGKFGVGGVVDDLWSVWRQRKIDEILAGSLLDLVIQQGDQSSFEGKSIKDFEREKQSKNAKVFLGANEGKAGGRYIPLMQKRKMETVDVLNARWLAAKQRKVERESQGDTQT